MAKKNLSIYYKFEKLKKEGERRKELSLFNMKKILLKRIRTLQF